MVTQEAGPPLELSPVSTWVVQLGGEIRCRPTTCVTVDPEVVTSPLRSPVVITGPPPPLISCPEFRLVPITLPDPPPPPPPEHCQTPCRRCAMAPKPPPVQGLVAWQSWQ